MPTISQDVMQVLDRAIIAGATLTLTGQLDRKLYQDTNKVIEAAGGKWNRKIKAHVFDGEALDAVEPILLTGEYRLTKQDFGQFDTPEELAERIVDLADVQAGQSVLEPSAGVGRIASAIRQVGAFVTCWEIDPKRAEKLPSVANSVNLGDFLTAEPNPVFDRVVMNPPFARQADIDHVLHAAKFLRDSGKLVAIMSASVLFRDNAKTSGFRQFVETRGGSFERLPDAAFKSSGTMVNTCIVQFGGPFMTPPVATAEHTACTIPPEGWECTRTAGHEGPCAAIPCSVSDDAPLAAIEDRDVDWVDVSGWGVVNGHAIPVAVARKLAERINLYHHTRASRALAEGRQS